jgi:carbamoyltransferase
MQRRINLSIKFRESFRPFAPSVLEEDAGEYFELNQPSPYMLLVKPLNKARCSFNLPPAEFLMDRLHQQRSDLPGITHVDYTARIQTVNKSTHPLYWQLLQTFKVQTGYGVLINTSFNVKDEPIVCSPADAIRCFMHTRMDALVLGNFLVLKPDSTD